MMASSTTGEAWTLGHRPALDGIRGVAVLLVMACHVAVPGLFAAGPVGVTVFFALSGFLITSLLVEEHAQSGRISLRRFYLRRVRRLAPAFLVSSAAIVAVGAAIGRAWFFEWSDVVPVLLYVGNWTLAGGGDLGAFGGTWSLAVEEQFYLAWPIVVIFALRRSLWALGVVAAGILAGSLLMRGYLLADGAPAVEVYYRTDTTASALAAGALLAAWVHRWGGGRWSVPTWGALVLLAAGSLATGVAALSWSPLVATVAGVALIHRSLNRPASWLSSRALVWFGRRSYALYLWHIVPAWVLREQTTMRWEWIAVIVFAFSCVAAELSWRYVERRALDGFNLMIAAPALPPA